MPNPFILLPLTVLDGKGSRVRRAEREAAAGVFSPHAGDDGAAACDAGERVPPGADTCIPEEAAYGEAGA